MKGLRKNGPLLSSIFYSLNAARMTERQEGLCAIEEQRALRQRRYCYLNDLAGVVP